VRTTGEERSGAAALEQVVLGVDTHLDAHVGVALDHLGRRLGALTLPRSVKGYEESSSLMGGGPRPGAVRWGGRD
jgi:hypothetical protein